jgi:F-type H+-transporting ATPase subunit delta
MLTRKKAAREAKQLFRLCFVDGALDEGRVRKVVETVLQLRRRGFLLLLESFQRLARLYCAQHLAKVESAAPVPEDLQTDVRSRLERVYGPGLMAAFTIDPTLIGGMRIQVGSDVYDGSVRFGLDKLQRSLGASDYNGRTN